MRDILYDMSEVVLIPAVEANLREEMACFGRYLPGGELHEDPEMHWMITSFISTVLRTSITKGDVDAKIDATLKHFQGCCRAMGWQVSPSTRPLDLVTYLQARGFTLLLEQPAMVADLQTLHEGGVTPPNFRITEVNSQEVLQAYCNVSMRGFGSDEEGVRPYYETYLRIGFAQDAPWRHYIGWLDDVPVTVSSRLFHAGIVGIYGVATVPQVRRQGLGTAMTLALLYEARQRGYRIAALTATDMSIGIYRRLGFRDCYTKSVYHKSWQENHT